MTGQAEARRRLFADAVASMRKLEVRSRAEVVSLAQRLRAGDLAARAIFSRPQRQPAERETGSWA
jgi:hypothetical protein